MSPWWRERVLVHIGVTEVRVQRRRGWGRGRVVGHSTAPLAGSDADALTAALAQALPSGQVQGGDVHATVSSAHVRLSLVPGAAALRGAQEHQAAAAHALARIHGDAVQGWDVAACTVGADTLLAAGMDAAAASALRAACGASSWRLASVQPFFVRAFNDSLKQLNGATWFVAAEPGWAVSCLVQGGELRALRSQRVTGNAAEDLLRGLERSQVLDGVGDSDTPVLLASTGLGTLDLSAWPRRVTQRVLDAEPALTSVLS